MNEKEKDEFLTPIINNLKQHFSGSMDYLSGVNDGAFALGKELLTGHEEARQVVNIKETGFDIDDSMFGDGSVTITVQRVFDTKQDAEAFVDALKVLCA